MSAVNDLVIACRQQGIVMAAEGEALRVEGPDEALTEELLSEIKAHKPDLLAALTQPADLGALLVEACQGVEGIDGATFKSLLSPEDVEDIEGGHIPVVTLNAYARSFAEGIRCGRITVLAAANPKTTLPSRVRCGDCLHFERDTISCCGRR